ncbi:MAG: helix-hairpin-helix domain-containing protein [Bacteroidota bacterium]
MNKRTFLLLLSLLISYISKSQEREIDLEKFAERLFQIQDENLEYEDIYESLLLFYTNKLNLNRVSPEELASLYVLSPIQVSSFFNYRDEFGKLISIYELQAIPNFDLTTIRDLLPFVTVEESSIDDRPFLRRVLQEENNYLLLRLTRRIEGQEGYRTDLPLDSVFSRDENDDVIDTTLVQPRRYLGSQNKIYGRFRTSRRGDFSIGFTFEKDQGEAFAFEKSKPGFDFYSYHLLLENKVGLDQILFGDFQMQVGQGLVFGAGFNAGKGAETVNTVKRNTIGLRPYTSVLESGFFRGIAVSKKTNDIEATVFYSRLLQDGRIQTDTAFSDFQEFVNSIQFTGFHRTEAELAGRNTIREESLGGFLNYRPNRRISIGFTALNTLFSRPLVRRPNNFNQFEFSGTHNFITSLYANYSWQNITFFGEAARSSSSGFGTLGGLIGSLSNTIDFALVLRNYERNFHSFYGNALSEGNRIINEKGTYWGLAFKPSIRHQLNFYYDRFAFPWLRFRTEAPSVGHEWLARYTFKPSRKVLLYLQARQQTRQLTIANDNLNTLEDQKRYNYIFNFDFSPFPTLQLRSKVQASTQHEANLETRGFAIVQDINFEIWRFKINTRAALFETDDFDNAQYVYESDVLYAFSIPAYNGVGIRSYAMIRYDPFSNASIWLRYARTSFSDRNTVGSGLEESQGNVASEIKLMLRLKL